MADNNNNNNSYDIKGTLLGHDVVGYGDEYNTNIFGGMPLTNNQNHKYRGLVADVGNSGQMNGGAGPRIMNLDGATPQIFPPAIIIMLQTPLMWKTVPDIATGQQNPLGRMLKNLWECHLQECTGIDVNLTLKYEESLVGQDGQQVSTPTNSQRAPISPSPTWVELYGNIVWNLHARWIMDINHPDTQNSYLSAIKALMAGQEGSDDYLQELPPWVFSTFSCSFMWIQPDPYGTYDRILDAGLVTAAFPTETGNMGVQKVTNTHQQMTRNIAYRGLLQHNDNTKEVGALIMKACNFHRPNLQRATTLATMDGSLIQSGISKQAAEAIVAFKDMVSDNMTLQNEGGTALINVLGQKVPATVRTADVTESGSLN